jgi:hypothetical protein
MPALRQAALEYPRKITVWKIIFTAGKRPNIYKLGIFLNTMHSWRLCLVGLWFRVTCFPPQLPFRSGGACIFVCIMSFWNLELLDCWLTLTSRGFCCCCSAKLWGTVLTVRQKYCLRECRQCVTLVHFIAYRVITFFYFIASLKLQVTCHFAMLSHSCGHLVRSHVWGSVG